MTKSQTMPASPFLKRAYAHDHRRRPTIPAALCILSVCGVMAAWGAPRAHAMTFTVTKLADTNDGTCDADCSLDEAINAANADTTDPSDTINFAAGLTGTIVLDPQFGQLEITAPVVINGPGRNTLSVSGNNASRVFAISGGTAANPVTINDLTITAGNSTNSATPNTGGAVLTSGVTNFTNVTVSNSSSPGAGTTAVGGGGIFNSGTLTLSNGIITGNTATKGLGNGGGILNTGTLTTNNGGSIDNNDAGRAGGGIENNGGTVTLNGIDLNTNTAGVNGGGLHTTGAGGVTVTGGTVRNNVAVQEGGGLWNSGSGTLTVESVGITANQAQGPASDQGGGGIYNDGGTVNVDQGAAAGTSSITGNSATGAAGSGGGILNVGGALKVNDATLSSNSAMRAGGGIETNGGTVTLINVILGGTAAADGNTASAAPGNGGGLHITGAGNATVTNSTVQNNLAALEGGGLWNSTGTMTVTNSRILNNQAQGAAADNGGGGIYNNGGTLNVTGGNIDSNSAAGTLGSGGGILNNGGTLTVNNSTLVNGTANRAGGAIETVGGTVDVTNSSLNGNSANINGGAVHITGAGTVTLANGTVNNNLAVQEGGGLWNSAGGTLNVNGTTLSGNQAQGNDADQGGGAIYGDGGALNVTGATITDNDATGTAGSGGGILNKGGALKVATSTLTSNMANRAGGAIETNAGTVTLTNSNLGGTAAAAGNTAGAAPGNGGGLHTTGAGNVTVTGGTVQNNTAANEGGGLWNSAVGTLNVNGTTISNNTAQGDGTDKGGGGGIYNDGGTTNVTNATIGGNIALAATVGNGGGGIFNAGKLTVATSNISANTANTNQATTGRGNGGGILNTAAGIANITGGTIAGNLAARAGGGIENNGGTVTLAGLTLGGNFANINGGGLHSAGGTVTASDCTVQSNIATQEGGGLWAAGTLNVARGLIAQNTANGNTANQGGGGVYVQTGGTTTINGTNIRANVATATAVGNGGGGIFNDAMLNLTNVVLAENTATNGTGNGGAILNSPLGTLTVNGARITGNKAARAGGGIENNGGTATLSVLMLNGNTTGINGGGLHNGGAGKVTLDKSAVYDNSANNEGGGLWNSGGGTLTVTNSTLNNNAATSEGGGVYTVAGGTTTLLSTTITSNRAGTGGGIASDGNAAKLANSIVALNTGGATPDVKGSITSQGYNLIGVGTGVVGLTSTDLSGTTAAPLNPNLGPLADNGGLTLTRTLLAGSPAINGGDPAIPVPSGTDQRGGTFTRVRAERIDIGALELQIDAPTVANVAISTNEDTTFTFSAATFDAGFQSTNSSNQVQTVRIDSLPTNGTLALNGTAVTVGQTIARADLGGLTYAPNANYNGGDAFTFSASDGFITASGAIANITVVPVNDAPVANSQQLRITGGGPVSITLTASDVDGNALTYFVGTDIPGDSTEAGKGIAPRYGTLSGTAPNLTYTPFAGYNGRDVFTFYVSDGTATSQQARIEILVSGNSSVSAGNDSYNLILGPSGQAQQTGVTLLSTGVFRIAAPGVLANDFRGTPATATLRLARTAQNGRLQLRADGGFDYFPSAGFAGTDGFAYTISDGRTTATAIVRLIVIDRRAPELRFDTPANGTVVKTVDKIAGRVRDRESGLKSITLLWQRFDGKFWNGSMWVSTSTELPLAVSGINWIYSGNLPQPGDDPATDLLDGNYDLRVTAMDKSNNTSRVTNRITVRNAAPTPPPTTPEFSAVTLSSAGASATQDIIVLRFTGALDEVVAINGDRYALTVNGVEVGIGNADYSENTVTLSNFELEADDQITLQISGLRDTEGKTLRGGQINLIAR